LCPKDFCHLNETGGLTFAWDFALARARELSLYFPWVNLNSMRDDLRMMAPNAVAAREGAMKQYRNCWHIMIIATSIIRRE
jgi:hypothetical protein